MGAALPDNNAFDCRVTARALLACTPKHIQFFAIITSASTYGVEIGFASPQRGSQVVDTFSQHFTDGPVQRPDF